MTVTEPAVVASGRYSVSEASKILDIDRKTLYRHTIDGIIKCGFRRANGRRSIPVVKYKDIGRRNIKINK